MDPVDSVLHSAASEHARTREIERILGVHEQDHFAALEVAWDSENVAAQAKQTFRRKTLLVHPDKTQHKEAPRAFDILRRAERVLTSTEDDLSAERDRLVAIYKDVNLQNQNVLLGPDLALRVRKVLEEEARVEEVEKAFERRQEEKRAKEISEQEKQREQKRQQDSRWEDERDQRVALWRDYSARVEKKKRKKKKVLA